MASNKPQIKELVLVGDVNSQLGAEIARRLNDLFYPVLIIGQSQEFLDGIEYSHPEIIASVEGKIDDIQFLQDVLEQVTPVFGALSKIVLTSGIEEVASYQSDKKTLPAEDNFKILVKHPVYKKFFSPKYLKKMTIISVSNFVPAEFLGKEMSRDSDEWNFYFDNFEIINVNPIDKNKILLDEKNNLGDFFTDDLIGRPPYSNQLAAILTERMINHLPENDHINFVQINLDNATVKNVEPAVVNEKAVVVEETTAADESKTVESDENSIEAEITKSKKAKVKESVVEPEPEVEIDDDYEEGIARADFISEPEAFNLSLDDLVKDNKKKRLNKLAEAASKIDEVTQANLVNMPENIAKLSNTVNDFSSYVDQVSATIEKKQNRARKTIANAKKTTTTDDSKTKTTKKIERVTKKPTVAATRATRVSRAAAATRATRVRATRTARTAKAK